MLKTQIFGICLKFLAEHEYGKEDVLVVYHQDEDGKQTDLLEIEEWGHTVGGLDTYMKKFWKIK